MADSVTMPLLLNLSTRIIALPEYRVNSAFNSLNPAHCYGWVCSRHALTILWIRGISATAERSLIILMIISSPIYFCYNFNWHDFEMNTNINCRRILGEIIFSCGMISACWTMKILSCIVHSSHCLWKFVESIILMSSLNKFISLLLFFFFKYENFCRISPPLKYFKNFSPLDNLFDDYRFTVRVYVS